MCVDGVDYICVDQQHGLVDYAEMVEMLRAIEGRRTAVPFTRVPVNQAWIICKALDAGMQGVVVPMVNNLAEAAAAVTASRHSPRVVMSFNPVRAAMQNNRRGCAV